MAFGPTITETAAKARNNITIQNSVVTVNSGYEGIMAYGDLTVSDNSAVAVDAGDGQDSWGLFGDSSVSLAGSAVDVASCYGIYTNGATVSITASSDVTLDASSIAIYTTNNHLAVAVGDSKLTLASGLAAIYSENSAALTLTNSELAADGTVAFNANTLPVSISGNCTISGDILDAGSYQGTAQEKMTDTVNGVRIPIALEDTATLSNKATILVESQTVKAAQESLTDHFKNVDGGQVIAPGNNDSWDFTNAAEDSGNLQTDGYKWDVSETTLTLGDLYLEGNDIILPAGAKVTIRGTAVVKGICS